MQPFLWVLENNEYYWSSQKARHDFSYEACYVMQDSVQRIYFHMLQCIVLGISLMFCL